MCTGIRFVDDQGQLFFGRNLDWNTPFGERILAVPSSYNPGFSFVKAPETPHELIGMGIVGEGGEPLFFDCANEAGLAIAGLNFPGYAAYAKEPIEGKTNIAAYEFPWWVAASFSSVDEVEAALAQVAIVAKPAGSYGVSMLHWIIADATRSIVVEYTEAGMQVFHDGFDVLTNQPGFDYHRENVRNYMALVPTMPADVDWRTAKLTPFGSGLGMEGLPGEFSSPARFVRAAYFNAHYPVQSGEAANVSRLFHTLTACGMIKGGAAMADGSFEYTIYTGGYSAATKTYYYSTYEDSAIRGVAMKEALGQGDGSKVIEIPLQ